MCAATSITCLQIVIMDMLYQSVLFWAQTFSIYDYSFLILAADRHPIRGRVGVFEWKCKEIHSTTPTSLSSIIPWKVSNCPPGSYWSCWKDVNFWSQTEDYWWVCFLDLQSQCNLNYLFSLSFRLHALV